MREQFSRKELLDLYRIAIDEYRFEVKLNWDRTMYYIVFNSALITVATGILKVADTVIQHLFLAAVFFVGIVSCVIGIVAARLGHSYYRRTIVKKTVIETLLGLTAPLTEYSGQHTLSIGTTPGQGEHLQVLHNTEVWLARKQRRSSVTALTGYFLILLCVINLLGMVAAVSLAFTHHTSERAEPYYLQIKQTLR